MRAPFAKARAKTPRFFEKERLIPPKSGPVPARIPVKVKKNSPSNAVIPSVFVESCPEFVKKSFGSLKKGRIFAPAFEDGARPCRGREDIEILRSRDSVCRKSGADPGGDTEESKVTRKIQAILTMKSLILAQDER